MNGFHFTVLGAVTTIAIAYWLLKYSSGAYTIATGGTKAVGNMFRAGTQPVGAA